MVQCELFRGCSNLHFELEVEMELELDHSYENDILLIGVKQRKLQDLHMQVLHIGSLRHDHCTMTKTIYNETSSPLEISNKLSKMFQLEMNFKIIPLQMNFCNLVSWEPQLSKCEFDVIGRYIVSRYRSPQSQPQSNQNLIIPRFYRRLINYSGLCSVSEIT